MNNQPNIRSVEQLLIAMDSEEKLKYLFFWGHTPPRDQSVNKACLSQWYNSPFIIKDNHYKTAEHYMMAEKAALFKDKESEAKIIESHSPHEAKKLGRSIKHFNESLWLQHRFDIVVNGNLAKFQQNEDLKKFLLNTNNRVLVEASPPDRIWGIGMAADHRDIENPNRWKGLNLLGFALMEVRDQLKFN